MTARAEQIKAELPKQSRKTLLVDIGGTLLKRSRSGAYTRARDWCRREAGLSERAAQLALARTILTAPTPESAAACVGNEIGLSAAKVTQLRVVLEESGGCAEILPGATELLQGARKLGWRVLLATNAVAWVDPLPFEIMQHLDGVLSSSDLKFIKEDPEFWFEFSNRVGLDSTRSLVIGDDAEADVIAPRAAGLAAIQIDHARITLFGILELMKEIGDPPDGTIGLISGQVSEWGGRLVLPADNLKSCIRNVTRSPISFCTRSVRIPGTVIQRSSRPPVVCIQDQIPTSIPSLAWVVVAPDRRRMHIPCDLSTALMAAKLDFSALTTRNKRHLISTVVEAKDPLIRKARIAEVVQFLKAGDNSRAPGLMT